MKGTDPSILCHRILFCCLYLNTFFSARHQIGWQNFFWRRHSGCVRRVLQTRCWSLAILKTSISLDNLFRYEHNVYFSLLILLCILEICIIYIYIYIHLFHGLQKKTPTCHEQKAAFFPSPRNHPHLLPQSQVIFGNQVVDVTSPTESCR